MPSESNSNYAGQPQKHLKPTMSVTCPAALPTQLACNTVCIVFKLALLLHQSREMLLEGQTVIDGSPGVVDGLSFESESSN